MKIETESDYDIPIPKIKKALQFLNSELTLNLDFLFLHFLSDEAVLKINLEYLDHDFYTDIITFDLRDELTNEAEIFISVDRIKENAETHSVPMQEELFRVCIHGLLHLAGFADKSTLEKIKMREMEDKYLESLFHVKHQSKP
jgi:rRNA maturation RNase YbeY